MKKVLVDGHYGTVNLNLNKMIMNRDDLEVIYLESRKRVTHEQRVSLLNTADIVILCQSAQTVVETIPLITNRSVKVIDTSNAYRLSPSWVYGMPELSPDQRKKIADARFVSLPAPMAVGTISLINPLLKGKILHQEKIF